MADIMLDIETFGTGDFAPIVELAACEFNIKTGEIGRTFSQVINLASNIEVGMNNISHGTLKFWSEQESFHRIVDACFSTDTTLHSALVDFRSFILQISSTRTLWAKGVDFDIRLLRQAYEKCAVDVPWSFREPSDCRTLLKLFPVPSSPPNHYALDDAVGQALALSKVLNLLKGTKGDS